MMVLRHLSPVARSVRKTIYDNNITISMVTDDKVASGRTARTLSSSPDLYIPTAGMTSLAMSGKRTLKAVCENFEVPEEFQLPCKEKMTADFVVVVDVESLKSHDSFAVSDLALLIIDKIDIEGHENIRTKIVLHEDGKSPKVYQSSEDARLTDLVWKLKHEGLNDDEGNPLDLPESVDFTATLEFVQRESIFTKRSVEAGRVVLVLTGRQIEEKDKMVAAIEEFASKKFTSIVISPNADVIVDTGVRSPLKRGLQMDKDAGPKKVISKSKAFLELACRTPVRPESPVVCEARMEMMFAVDSDIKNKVGLVDFFNKISTSVGFESPMTLLTEEELTLDGSYKQTIAKFATEEEFNMRMVLQLAVKNFRKSHRNARRVLVVVSSKPSHATGVEKVMKVLRGLGVTVVAVTVETDYFLPAFSENHDYHKVHLTDGKYLAASAGEVVSIACTPTPVVTETLEPKNVTCPTGQMTFLYDIALFAPMRDGRKVNLFIKNIMKLLQHGSTYSRFKIFLILFLLFSHYLLCKFLF